MVRVKDTQGVPVICLKDDGRAGYIDHPLYDQYNTVRGFTVDAKGLGLGKKYIPLDDILRIDATSCVIYSEKSIKRLKKSSKLKNAGGLAGMLGRNVVDRDGRAMGFVRDMVFDMETGYVEGFELSKGFMEDIVSGRDVIFLKDGVEFGEEYIVFGGKSLL